MAIDTDALAESIAENVAGPKSATVDGQTVSQHDLDKQLDALERLEERQARRRRTLPVRIAKVQPGGTL